jgi:hypothetical protein
MDATELRERLSRLYTERRAAEAAGLGRCGVYMRDLTREISETHAAFIGASVTEIAVERARLLGPLSG